MLFHVRLKDYEPSRRNADLREAHWTYFEDHADHFIARGATFDGHFAHQTRLHQIPQIVVSGGPGTARIRAIHRFENFRSGGMTGVLHQEGTELTVFVSL